MRKLIVMLLVLLLTFQGQANAHTDEETPPLDAVGAEALRFCESTNDYTKVHREYVPSNDTWQNSRGAYQFAQPTWDSVMHNMARDNYLGTDEWAFWIGVPPDQAPHWVQDNAAKYHWDAGFQNDWPNCHVEAVNAMITTPNKRVGPIGAPRPVFAGWVVFKL